MLLQIHVSTHSYTVMQFDLPLVHIIWKWIEFWAQEFPVHIKHAEISLVQGDKCMCLPLNKMKDMYVNVETKVVFFFILFWHNSYLLAIKLKFIHPSIYPNSEPLWRYID